MKQEIAEELPDSIPRLNLSASVAPLMAAACEMFIAEMTIKANAKSEMEKRKTLQ